MPLDIRWHPKTTKKEGEMKVWVRCARGVQVAYVTLHERGCTVVPPSTWAKRVPGVGSKTETEQEIVVAKTVFGYWERHADTKYKLRW